MAHRLRTRALAASQPTSHLFRRGVVPTTVDFHASSAILSQSSLGRRRVSLKYCFVESSDGKRCASSLAASEVTATNATTTPTITTATATTFAATTQRHLGPHSQDEPWSTHSGAIHSGRSGTSPECVSGLPSHLFTDASLGESWRSPASPSSPTPSFPQAQGGYPPFTLPDQSRITLFSGMTSTLSTATSTATEGTSSLTSSCPSPPSRSVASNSSQFFISTPSFSLYSAGPLVPGFHSYTPPPPPTPISYTSSSPLSSSRRRTSIQHPKFLSQTNMSSSYDRRFASIPAAPQNGESGYQILREPAWNKGLSFNPSERTEKKLAGLIPHAMESVETQVARCMKMINTRSTPIDKYLYLSSLKNQNLDLFYRVLIDNVRQLMPLVYTPTIGDVCLQYSSLYTRPEALYISIKQRKSIKDILRNWPYANPEICVVTDGSRILGLGDLGINGVGISVGKLALYTGAAGIAPEKTLPIVLDCGTNNEENLQDPLYLGIRAKRPSPEIQQEFMDDFMEAVREVYPEMMVQFEDFETEKAFNYLARYRDNYKCFNDDIQGTGAVVLGGYIGAVDQSGVPIEEQRLVFMGAGSAGVGVAKQMVEYYTRRGLSEEEARNKFWLVDTKGLVTLDRGDKLAEHKKYFARTDNGGLQFRTLEDVIQYVKPSALVGLTATFGVFTEPVVRALKESVEAGGAGRRPILFPLSNPLTKAECTFEQAVQWTDGTVIFASGSPFSPFSVKPASGGDAVTYYPNQGNNVYVFPGLGLGAILAQASRVTDEMVYISAQALSESLNEEEIAKGLIYPHIERVRDASVVVAREVMKAARREEVSELPNELWAEFEEWGDVAIDKFIKARVYDPLR